MCGASSNSSRKRQANPERDIPAFQHEMLKLLGERKAESKSAQVNALPGSAIFSAIPNGRGPCNQDGRTGSRCLVSFPWPRTAHCNTSRILSRSYSSDAHTFWPLQFPWHIPPVNNDDLWESQVTLKLPERFIVPIRHLLDVRHPPQEVALQLSVNTWQSVSVSVKRFSKLLEVKFLLRGAEATPYSCFSR